MLVITRVETRDRVFLGGVAGTFLYLHFGTWSGSYLKVLFLVWSDLNERGSYYRDVPVRGHDEKHTAVLLGHQGIKWRTREVPDHDVGCARHKT